MVRKCTQCSVVLSQYNHGTLCFQCQEKKQKELIEKIDDGPNYDITDMCFILGLGYEQTRRLGQERKVPGRIPEIKRHL